MTRILTAVIGSAALAASLSARPAAAEFRIFTETFVNNTPPVYQVYHPYFGVPLFTYVGAYPPVSLTYPLYPPLGGYSVVGGYPYFGYGALPGIFFNPGPRYRLPLYSPIRYQTPASGRPVALCLNGMTGEAVRRDERLQKRRQPGVTGVVYRELRVEPVEGEDYRVRWAGREVRLERMEVQTLDAEGKAVASTLVKAAPFEVRVALPEEVAKVVISVVARDGASAGVKLPVSDLKLFAVDPKPAEEPAPAAPANAEPPKPAEPPKAK